MHSWSRKDHQPLEILPLGLKEAYQVANGWSSSRSSGSQRQTDILKPLFPWIEIVHTRSAFRWRQGTRSRALVAVAAFGRCSQGPWRRFRRLAFHILNCLLLRIAFVVPVVYVLLLRVRLLLEGSCRWSFHLICFLSCNSAHLPVHSIARAGVRVLLCKLLASAVGLDCLGLVWLGASAQEECDLHLGVPPQEHTRLEKPLVAAQGHGRQRDRLCALRHNVVGAAPVAPQLQLLPRQQGRRDVGHPDRVVGSLSPVPHFQRRGVRRYPDTPIPRLVCGGKGPCFNATGHEAEDHVVPPGLFQRAGIGCELYRQDEIHGCTKDDHAPANAGALRNQHLSLDAHIAMLRNHGNHLRCGRARRRLCLAALGLRRCWALWQLASQSALQRFQRFLTEAFETKVLEADVDVPFREFVE
mmetsp:Transcript_2262/g.6450  ORF Transcript_2262/g.6450 Transcript_2262/m.6450 type:complete len:413 (-) Transcript_2262:224-1462(-)